MPITPEAGALSSILLENHRMDEQESRAMRRDFEGELAKVSTIILFADLFLW